MTHRSTLVRRVRSAAGLLALPLALAVCDSGSGPIEQEFIAVLSGSGALIPTGRCQPEMTLELTGTGTTAPGGSMTGRMSHCSTGSGSSFRLGSFSFTYPDGNVLEGTYEGTATAASETRFDIDGTWTLTSGSGYFQGATGGGTLEGEVDLAANQGTITLSGSVER